MRCLFILGPLFLASALQAQPGVLDPSFGTGGVVRLHPDLYGNNGWAVATLPDNSMLVAGHAGISNPTGFVAHLHQDGNLDTSFGAGGIRIIDAEDQTWVRAITALADGSLLVVGVVFPGDTLHAVMLAKLTPTGDMDGTFGNGGIVQTTLNERPFTASNLAVQPDGRIVVSGYMKDSTQYYNSVLLRYNEDGSLDPSFNDDGIIVLTNWPSDDEFQDVTLMPDGSVIAVGSTVLTGAYRSLMVKVDSTGAFDSDFGTNGQFLPIDGVENSWARGVAVVGDAILVGGFLDVEPGQRDGYVAKFHGNGTIDAAFNGSGISTLNYNIFDTYEDIAVQPNGQLVLCGTTGTFNDMSHHVLLSRFNADGSPDADFNAQWLLSSSTLTDAQIAWDEALQPDGRIVLCGYESGNPSSMLVARCLPDACTIVPVVSPEALVLCPNSADQLSTGTFDSYQWYKNGAEIPGATAQTLPVTSADDAGAWFKVRAANDTCFGFSDSVLVDGYVFPPPTISQAGDTPNLIGDEGEQIYCQGDAPILVLDAPYDTNVQWYSAGEPIVGAVGTALGVSTSGSYSVHGAPATCPNYIQDAGVAIVMEFHPNVQPVIVQSGDLLCPEPEGISAQWYFNGQPIAGIEQCTFPVGPGAYTVFVDYGDSCSVLSGPFTVVGMEERARSILNAWPVPTGGSITISGDPSVPLPAWDLLDACGRVVLHGPGGRAPLLIDLGALENGHYRFRMQDGRALFVAVAH